MRGYRCGDNKSIEVEEAPVWLRKKYPQAIYWYTDIDTCYILALRDVLMGEWSRYLVDNKIYGSMIVGSKQQLETIKEVYDKMQGYAKINLFDL